MWIAGVDCETSKLMPFVKKIGNTGTKKYVFSPLFSVHLYWNVTWMCTVISGWFGC